MRDNNILPFMMSIGLYLHWRAFEKNKLVRSNYFINKNYKHCSLQHRVVEAGQM